MWLDGLITALSVNHLILLFLGTVIGLLIGAAPGLGPVFGLSLFLSMTFRMSPSEAVIFMGALYASSVYGGSISAILLNTPGTPGNVATTFDGHAMARQGRGGEALGISTMSSFVGGIFGVLSLALLTPLLAKVSLIIGPPEYFMLALAGLSLVAVAAKGDTVRGLIMGGFGLMLTFVGRDVITGADRFTFDSLYLEDGIQFVPLVIGVFAFAQAMVLANQQGTIAAVTKATGVMTGIIAVIKRPFTLIRNAVIGIIIGSMPGIGINAANFVAYLVEKNLSKDPEKFGKGSVEGIMAPETANNACSSAELIPALAMGIPGGSTAALFLSALMIHGITPGYDFFNSTGNLFPTVIWGLLLAQVAFLILGSLGANYFAKITQVPNAILVPIIMVLSYLGAFALRNQPLDMLLMVLMGLLGYYMLKYNYPSACLVLGVILGGLAESNFGRAMRISHGSLSVFVTRPVSLALLLIIILSLCFPYIKPQIMKLFNKPKAA